MWFGEYLAEEEVQEVWESFLPNMRVIEPPPCRACRTVMEPDRRRLDRPPIRYLNLLRFRFVRSQAGQRRPDQEQRRDPLGRGRREFQCVPRTLR
jgi:hypothetical protein